MTAARIAFVHDWLVTPGGAELLLAEALKEFPGTPVAALIDHMSEADHAALGVPRAGVTWMQGIPGIAKRYRSLLPMMPAAMRSLAVPDADVLVAISHAVAQGVRPRPGQKLIVLSLSPMRYAWDLRDQYLEESGLDSGATGALARFTLEQVRQWDARNAERVHAYAAISKYIADRVKRCYGRDAVVIYPPVDTEYFTPPSSARSADAPYLTASRFVPYKRVDLIVRAFAQMPARKLVVVGDGPDFHKVRAAAAGAANITFTGRLGREALREQLRAARAFVFAADEDFGIAPVEAQACGTPVIAFGRGGALETVTAQTGVFFDQQTESSLIAAVEQFESRAAEFTPAACRANAERFNAARFRREFREWVFTAGSR